MTADFFPKNDKMGFVVRFFLLALVLFGPVSHGEPRSLAEKARKSLKLSETALRVELARQTVIPEARNKPRLPQRVYLEYSERLGTWSFVLTDAKGRLPQETIAVGTVLGGDYLGGDPATRYELNYEREWVPTRSEENLRVWKLDGKKPERRDYLLPSYRTNASKPPSK